MDHIFIEEAKHDIRESSLNLNSGAVLHSPHSVECPVEKIYLDLKMLSRGLRVIYDAASCEILIHSLPS